MTSLFDTYSPTPESAPAAPSFKLRPYQLDAVNAVDEALQSARSTLVVKPTGTGKTVVFAHVILRRSRRRAFVLAHREELLTQAADKIYSITGRVTQIEQAENYAYRNHSTGVVVGSVQSAVARRGDGFRVEQFNPNDFDLLVIDEAHHAVADTYRRVIAHFLRNPDLRVVGVTATPDRADEAALGQVFESVAFEYEIGDAIHDGWLVPIRQRLVDVEGLDYSTVRTTAGDLNQGDVAEIVEREQTMHMFAHPTIELAGERKALVFAATVKQAEGIADILNRHRTDCARVVTGTTPSDERRELFHAYARGAYQFLVNVGVATEGFDDPSIAVVAMCRPTKSRALYCLDEQTEILTASGWRRDVEVGEEVAALVPGSPISAVEFVPALAKVRRPVLPNERWVSLNSDAFDIRVTEDHRMLYDHKRRTGLKFKTAIELSRLSSGCYLPVAGEQQFPGINLTDDEIRFVAWVMTDGTINATNGQITITQGQHQPWLESIQDVIDECGFKHNRFVRERDSQFNSSSPSVVWTISKGKPRGRDKHLRGWKDLQPWLSKDLATPLMQMSHRQFAIFAQTLHMGDGAKQDNRAWTRRSYHISGANKVMMDRLQIMAVLRGWRANITTGNWNANPIYIIHLKPKRLQSAAAKHDGRPTWKVSQSVDGETCWCVENKHGTLITRRNGKVVIVGNCQMVGRGTRPLPGLVDSWDTADLRRRSIADSGKPSVEIIDFVGNSGKHKLVTTADILGGNYDDDVVDLAREIAKGGESTDMLGALEQAKELIHEKKKRASESARKREEARQAAANKGPQVTAQALYLSRECNPFDVLDIEPQRERGYFAGKPVSEAMKKVLQARNFNPDQLSFTHAKQVIDEIRKRDMLTVKQANLLRKYKLNPEKFTCSRAGQLIGQFAQSGWRLNRAWVKPDDFAVNK